MENNNSDKNMFVLEGVLEDFDITRYRIEQHRGENEKLEAEIVVEDSNPTEARERALKAYADKVIAYSGANSVNLGPQSDTLYFVESFVARFGDKYLAGGFSGAGLLKSGDRVKAVVEETKNYYLVHAIIRERDELLWLPVTMNRGAKNVRRMNKLVILGWGALTVLATFLFALGMGGNGWFEEFSIVASAEILMFGGMYLFGGSIGSSQGEVTEKIFRLLGFPDPENLSVNAGRYEFLHSSHITGIDIEYKSVYYYGLVLAARQAGKRGLFYGLPKLPVETADNQTEVHEAYLKLKEMVSQPKT